MDCCIIGDHSVTPCLRLAEENLFSNTTVTWFGEPMSSFKVTNTHIKFSTQGEIDFIDLSEKIQETVSKSGIQNGIVHVFAPHATGILILTENDPALLRDIKEFLEELAPKNQTYSHPSNAHSHLRSMMFPPDKTLPIIGGRVEYGTWQSLLFVETDVYPRNRTVIIQVLGEN
jgi:secondary thiamine-phosphate synthase enzyme